MHQRDHEPFRPEHDDALGDWRTAAPPKPVSDPIGVASYLAAAAIVLPIAWWLKDSHAATIGRFLLSPFGY